MAADPGQGFAAIDRPVEESMQANGVRRPIGASQPTGSTRNTG